MIQYALPLSSPALTLALAGGKGANLQRLLAAAFPVPPGFVLTTAAYDAFVDANGLPAVIGRETEATDPADPASFEAASRTIRAAFRRGEMPAGVEEALSDAYRELTGEAVAVRSSATAEDLPEASFAGQQDTYLNVQGEEALREAVVGCWSSLWTARAMAYRARQSIPPQAVSLAVVVQAMVPAEVAGVLFTVNPVTGAADEMVINATWGLGEALVGGMVNPDTLVLEKKSGRVRKRSIGEKAVMTVAGNGGTVEEAVAEERQATITLGDGRAAELARLGRAIEGVFGAPQDIEWALANGEIAVLQSRPVTAVASPPGVPGDDAWPPVEIAANAFDFWTQADVGERWPEPVTPFTWSTAAPMLNESMAGTFEGMEGAALAGVAWARRDYGRVYMNEGAMVHFFNDFYGMPASIAAPSLARPERIRPEQDRWRWGTLLRRAPLVARMTVRWERNAKAFEESFAQIERRVDAFLERDLSELDDAAVWSEAQQEWYPRLMHNMEYHAQILSMGLTSFYLMRTFLDNAVGRPDLIYELLAGLEGVIAAQMVPDLWEVAQAMERAGVAAVVTENEPKVALARLRQMPEAAPALEQLDAFLQRHGHRAPIEAEWRSPRWIEAPEPVIEMIAGYLAGGETPRAVTEDGAQARQRQAGAAAQVEAAVDPFRRAYFRSGLARLQRMMRLRDNGQHYLVRLLLPIRRLYATLAERWAARGWLTTADDFYFLVVGEIEALLVAGDPAQTGLDLATIVAERRAAYHYWLTQTAPEALDATGKPVADVALADGGLVGMAASAGRVEGVARVVNSPAEASRLQPGEILVTHATDPGWTPVFATIGGLVLEVGGQLSHGAIVAREYGLPAVVGVAQATRRIEDGQRVLVDGTAGRVHIQGEGEL